MPCKTKCSHKKCNFGLVSDMFFLSGANLNNFNLGDIKNCLTPIKF